MPRYAPLFGLGAVSICGAAHAQGVVAERRLDIGVTVINTYDTNLLRLASGERAPPGQSRDDIRATPSFTIDVEQPLGRQSIFLAGSAGYDFYADNNQLERERIELTGGANLNLQACGARLSASFGKRQSDLADILTGERQVNAQSRMLYDAQVSCGGFGPLEPSFGYQRERVENSDPLRSNGNTTSDAYSLSMNFNRPVFGRLGVGVSYTDGRYDRTPDLPPGQVNGTQVYTASLNFERRLLSQVTGTASVGLTRVDPRLVGVPGFKGLSYSADLTFNPGTRLQARIGLSREAQQPNLLSISYAITDNVQGQVRYALGNRLQLVGTADYSRRKLRDSALTPGPVLQTEDRQLLLSAGATFRAGDRVSLSLDGRREQRRSNFADLNFNNVSVALTTRLTI